MGKRKILTLLASLMLLLTVTPMGGSLLWINQPKFPKCLR